MRDKFLRKAEDDTRLYGLEYMLADVDDQSGFPHYYGYTSYNGSFYIMKEASSGSISYSRVESTGRGQYSQSWQARTKLIYLPWDGTF